MKETLIGITGSALATVGLCAAGLFLPSTIFAFLATVVIINGSILLEWYWS